MPMLMTTEQVCEQLQVSRSTIYELVARGAFRPVKVGRCRRYLQEEVVRYARRGGDSATAADGDPAPGDDPEPASLAS